MGCCAAAGVSTTESHNPAPTTVHKVEKQQMDNGGLETGARVKHVDPLNTGFFFGSSGLRLPPQRWSTWWVTSFRRVRGHAPV